MLLKHPSSPYFLRSKIKQIIYIYIGESGEGIKKIVLKNKRQKNIRKPWPPPLKIKLSYKQAKQGRGCLAPSVTTHFSCFPLRLSSINYLDFSPLKHGIPFEVKDTERSKVRLALNTMAMSKTQPGNPFLNLLIQGIAIRKPEPARQWRGPLVVLCFA